MLDLDILSFNSLADSVSRIQAEDFLTNASLTAMAFNDPKALNKEMKRVKKALKRAFSSDAFDAAFGGAPS